MSESYFPDNLSFSQLTFCSISNEINDDSIKKFIDNGVCNFMTTATKNPTICNKSQLFPRILPLPTIKAKSKWEKFAEKKGISKRKKSAKVYDEVSDKWLPRHGGKSAKNHLDNWFQEIKN